jgi:PAS domain S-box-containing protein/putative nucleotidyltransferase with HDIG domain
MKNKGKTKTELITESRKEQGKEVRDITQLKKAEQSLQESENRFKELFNNMSSGVAIYEAKDDGRDFIIKDFNRAGERMSKVKRENIIGKSVLKVFTGVKDFGLFKVFQEVYKTSKPQHFPISLYKDQRITAWRENYVYKIPSGEIVAVYDDITGRKQGEEKLQDSEEYLHVLFDYAPDAYYINDLKGNFIDGNKKAEKLSGYKREELIGKNFLELKLLSTEYLHKAAKSLEKNAMGLPTGPEEYVIIRKDRSTVTVEISNYPIKIKGKTLLLSIARDITERKQAGKDLAESAKKYYTLFENTGTAMIIAEEDMTISVTNRQFEQLSGYSKEEIENKMKWTELIIPEDLARMKGYSLLRRKEKGSAPASYEFSLCDKLGRIKNIWLTIAMIPGTKKAVASLVDITERKQSEMVLRESESKFRSIFDNATDGILLADLEKHKFYSANNTICQMLGYKQEEIVNLTTTDIHPREYLPYITEQFEKQTRKEITLAKDIPVKRKDGSFFYADVNSKPITLAGKTYLLGIFRDITERKLAEEQLQQSYQRTKRAMDATLETMSKIVEAKDPYTAGHQQRVSQLATAIAKELNLSQDKVEGVRIASLIHDIGKIGLPTEILSKPIKLSDIEFSLIKEHPQIGYNILKSIDFSYPVANIVLQHHERPNGSGYPMGFKGEEILLEARIIGVADVVEAMSSHRPYRPALGIDKALEEISQNKGILYDPKVVDICLNLFKEKEFKFE